VAANQRDTAVLEPRDRLAVVQIVDHRVAPRQGRGDIDPAGHRFGCARNPPHFSQGLGGP